MLFSASFDRGPNLGEHTTSLIVHNDEVGVWVRFWTDLEVGAILIERLTKESVQIGVEFAAVNWGRHLASLDYESPIRFGTHCMMHQLRNLSKWLFLIE